MSKNKKTNNIEKSTLSENLLDTRGAAKYLNLKQKQLQNYRGHKKGPKYIKIKDTCFYNIYDLDEWNGLKKKKEIKAPVLVDSLKKIKNVGDNKVIAKVKPGTDGVIQVDIKNMDALVDSKKGFFVNKTDIAIFKNIMLTLASLNKEVEALKKKLK